MADRVLLYLPQQFLQPPHLLPDYQEFLELHSGPLGPAPRSLGQVSDEATGVRQAVQLGEPRFYDFTDAAYRSSTGHELFDSPTYRHSASCS